MTVNSNIVLIVNGNWQNIMAFRMMHIAATTRSSLLLNRRRFSLCGAQLLLLILLLLKMMLLKMIVVDLIRMSFLLEKEWRILLSLVILELFGNLSSMIVFIS